MTTDQKQIVRVTGHIVSAATWVWAFFQALITGNWKAFTGKIAIGLAGHVATELILG